MPPRIRDVSTVLNNSGINIIPSSSPVSTSSPVFLKSTCASNSSRLSQSFSCTSTPSTSKTDKCDINGDAQSDFSTPTLTKKLNARKVLIRAIQLACKDITESDIDKFTKDWLKHAPKRFESEIKRKHAQKHQD
ncbi:hypothetical protein RN001_001515 [Aquatica leii]|uniref:Uncharacterized protein n=1 Tax=Aquatica leii TaxID=1421715 RepID=A0AAN7Q453_9COLE|nr:hypothetical protein RN001_001515 [Aquatica leii]